MNQRQSQFPSNQSGFNYAFSDEPILLNGMKVIFDQSVSVYPVSLQSKSSLTQLAIPHQMAKQKNLYSKPFMKAINQRIARRVNVLPEDYQNFQDYDGQVRNPDESTVQGDWLNQELDAQTQYQSDIKLWLNTIYPITDELTIFSDKYNEQRKILQRIFSVLRFGELKYRTRKDDDVWLDWDKPIAAALSHGGRVLIRIGHNAYGRIYPQHDFQHRHHFWNWLVTGNFVGTVQPEINEVAQLIKRKASTHHIKFNTDTGPYEIKLLKSNLTHQSLFFVDNYGMNIALGGEGGKNAKGDPIQANGLHGHLFLKYILAPNDSNWDCAIMIGCETTRPPDFPGEKGEGHLGTTHSVLGSAQKVSVTGGKKWTDIADGPPGKNDCMRIDINTIGELLTVTTFNEIQQWDVQQELSQLSRIIETSNTTDVSQSFFELHDGYRNIVKDWLSFIPAQSEDIKRDDD